MIGGVFGSARVIAIAAALGACAHSEPRGPETAPAPAIPSPPATHTPPLAPAATTNARLRLSRDSWLDIAVDTTTEDARRTCEVIVAREARRLPAPIHAEVARACQPTLLDEVPRVAGSAVLARTDPLDELELLLLGLPSSATTSGRVTRATRYPAPAECERVRRTLAEAARRTHAHAASAERGVLDEQLAIEQEVATRICDKAHAIAERCQAMPGDLATEAVCRDRPGKPCEEARDLARDRSFCEDLNHATQRECTAANDRVTILRNKAPPHESAPDVGTCRPE